MQRPGEDAGQGAAPQENLSASDPPAESLSEEPPPGYGPAPAHYGYGPVPPPYPQPFGYPPMAYPAAAAKPTSGLAIASLVCAGVGFFALFVPCFVGFILGLVALRQTGEGGPRSGRGMAIGGTVANGILGFFGVMILGLAALPLITSNTESARISEARAAMGVIKDRARVVVMQRGMVGRDAAPTLAELDLGNCLDGAYYISFDYSTSGTVDHCTITCKGVYNDHPQDLKYTVNLLNGQIVTDYNR